MTQRFNSIASVVADLQRGKMVIVVDDADRENEGDLIMAAQFVTPAAVNFMAKHGRGLICVPTTSERLQQLGVERMVRQNRETFKTDFQVSVDAARGITTGISAGDRAETIRIMAEPTAVAVARGRRRIDVGRAAALRAQGGDGRGRADAERPADPVELLEGAIAFEVDIGAKAQRIEGLADRVFKRTDGLQIDERDGAHHPVAASGDVGELAPGKRSNLGFPGAFSRINGAI